MSPATAGVAPDAARRRRQKVAARRGPLRKLVRSVASNHGRWTREGASYIIVWIFLAAAAWYQQVNLLFLVTGLALGPILASLFVGSRIIGRVRVTRRVPPYVFAGEPLNVDYMMENFRTWTPALAMTVDDHITPVDRSVSGSVATNPRVFFPRVPGRGKVRLRWQGPGPARGKYAFRWMDIITRSPFGLMERWATVGEPDEVIVYPKVGQLTRRWYLMHKEASETRRGQRHDLSTQQQEYHGLRDYRPGDSVRWIHWRTSARLGVPMVKEFEQHHEQDLAVLLDPWLPRSKVTPEQREALEEAIRFVATVCLETCRHQGRRLLVGWTGATPGLRQGPASVKLLHEALEQLAVMKSTPEGRVSALLDAMPAAMLREAILVIVSTRPVNLSEEAERSTRLSGVGGRGLLGRVVFFDASRGDLADLIQYGRPASEASAARRDGEDSMFDRISGGPSRESLRSASDSTAAAKKAKASVNGKPRRA